MLVSMNNINKSFAGIPALQNAALKIDAGEVMALVGQNGAGKSTLIKCLTGVHSADSGMIEYSSQTVRYKSPAESQAAGIATIYQEINLAANRTVVENVFMGRELSRFGMLHKRGMRQQTVDLLNRFNLDIEVNRPIADFDAATRQIIAIARAVGQQARLLIMDEPTSSLDDREVETLFDIIRTLRDDGVSMLFIGHRLSELYAVCDRVTIMRDGHTVAVHDLSRDQQT